MILKQPKRTNSQNAESNSSEENSPTKLKRRVSFAEKKSVKEFADSLEQGTVWDSTYEESDSSQIRVSHSEYSKSLVQTSSHVIYQSINYQEDTRLPSLSLRPEIEFKFPTEASNPRISHVDPEILANKENMPEILGLETIESSLVEVDDIPVQTPGFAVYCDEDNFNGTIIEDVPMECTIVADALVPVNTEELDRTQIFVNESVEFTEAVPLKVLKSSLVDKAPMVFDNSMEMTEAVPSNLFRGTERTEVFNDKSMEFTEAIPSVKLLSGDKTVFHNKSMELTEAIPSLKLQALQYCQDRTQFFNNTSMELTEAVPRTDLLPRGFAVDKTEVLHNRSMELTEAIPSCLKVLSTRHGNEVTQFFNNKSMELTEAIRPQTNFLRKVPEDKTEVFQNKSMELTEAIAPSLKLNSHDTTQFHGKSLKLTEAFNNFTDGNFNEEGTQFFNNKSMDMTGVVSLILHQDKRFEERTEVFDKSMEITQAIPSSIKPLAEEKTQVFHNKSMEITEAIRLLSENKTDKVFPSQEEKTQFFSNKSMEITEALGSLRENQKYRVPPSQEEKTQFFNKSMEITEAIHALSENQKERMPRQEEKTQFFSNKSMEITEALGSLSENKIVGVLQEEKTQFLSNKSMETIQVISSKERENLEIDHNYFMENTVSINPSLKRNYKCIADPKTPKSAISSPNPKNPRDCQVVDRKASMEALHRILHQDLEDLGPSFPDTFSNEAQDDSMEMTVAIPSVKLVEPEVPVVEPASNVEDLPVNSSSQAEDSLSSKDLPEACDEVPVYVEAAEDPEDSKVEIPVNSMATFNYEETLADFDDKIPENDMGATSVFLEETPSFMYASDLDLDTDVQNDSEASQDLDGTREQEEKSSTSTSASECSKFEESGVESISTGDLSGSSLKRSILENDEEEIERKKFILKCKAEDLETDEENEQQESMMEDSDVGNQSQEVIEKIFIPEIGNVEASEINIRLQKLILRDEMVNRRLKVCRLENSQKFVEKKQKPETLRQSESKTRYDILKEGLEEYAKSRSCIWRIHTINPEVICIEFYKTALVFGVRIEPGVEEERILRVRVLPRVNDQETEMLRITDRLIMKAIDCDKMAESYFTYTDVPNLIADVTEKVHFVYDFYDELVKFHRVNLVDLVGDILTVTVRTKKMETIIKLIIDIASYPSITPEDITIIPILGFVKEEDVKNLVKNLKPSPKLLTLYINDVKQLFELLAIANSKS